MHACFHACPQCDQHRTRNGSGEIPVDTGLLGLFGHSLGFTAAKAVEPLPRGHDLAAEDEVDRVVSAAQMVVYRFELCGPSNCTGTGFVKGTTAVPGRSAGRVACRKSGNFDAGFNAFGDGFSGWMPIWANCK